MEPFNFSAIIHQLFAYVNDTPCGRFPLFAVTRYLKNRRKRVIIYGLHFLKT